MTTLDHHLERRFAAHLHTLRTLRGWSQQHLADQTGITRTAISHIENGRRGVPLAEAVALADALGVQLADLIRPASP